MLSQTDLSKISEVGIEQAWLYFKGCIEEISDEVIPDQRIRHKRSIYMNREAFRLKNRKDKSFRKYNKSNSEADLQR